ncbi:RNA polymerase sigma factor [Chryseomicrobium sp. FSL W7-1435]|uniref:RNA polymerase sigma factor n=1 Tax=Chryseomicrobium sp. FSL W7-1435 TaxID=2921704 RepID=UPI00315A10A5
MTVNIIEAAQQGDLAAYEQLIHTYKGTVERFAFQCGANYQDVPDISQEVFIRLYRFLDQFNRDRFTTWLYKVTLNTTRDHYRKETQHSKKEQRLQQNDTQFASDSETTFMQSESDRELHIQIQQLDEKYRVPLVLFYFQDCSYSEIATILSLSLGTVKIRIHRAKDLLRTAFEEQEAKLSGN